MPIRNLTGLFGITCRTTRQSPGTAGLWAAIRFRRAQDGRPFCGTELRARMCRFLAWGRARVACSLRMPAPQKLILVATGLLAGEATTTLLANTTGGNSRLTPTIDGSSATT